jgi:hypothetical protein
MGQAARQQVGKASDAFSAPTPADVESPRTTRLRTGACFELKV